MDSITELATLSGGLSSEELEILSQAVGDVVRDTPRTPTATAKLKLLLPKFGAHMLESARQVLVTIATESAKKELGL